MEKTNKKSINYGSKILVILAFVLIFAPFNKASAQSCWAGSCDYTFYGDSSSNYNNNSYYNSTPYQAPVYTPPSSSTPTPIVYSNETNPNATNTTTVPAKTVAKAKTTSTSTTSTSNTVAATNPESASDLASSVVLGSNSFLPSGLIQWILFGIFILLLIILVRRTFGGRENYLATPLKHE